jgi:DNA processing protein
MFSEPDLHILDLLALSLVPGLGPRLTTAILERFGSAAAARRATPVELRSIPHIGEKLSADFSAALRDADVEAELRALREHDVGIVSLGSPDYPAALHELPDPPHLLFQKGSVLPQDRKAIAIVGSRECTSYGRRMTERLAAGLVRVGYTIVSGLARGIDGVAHDAALKAGGRTIAVLAGGLSRIYPPEHGELARRVAEAGALLTETSMRQAPQAGMFPARNRLISGLSLGVVVIEAHERSGALITARHAAEQNREVFALPGQADSIASAGCLQLIRNGAKLVRNAEDILEEIEGIAAPAAKTVRELEKPAVDLAPPEAQVWNALAGGTRHIDQLAQELRLAIPDLSRTLMQLELKRAVKRLPGNQYERR